MNKQAYEKKYHNGDGKFVDNWMEGIKFLPFTSNPTNAFDKKCSLQGVAGEYFRLWEKSDTQPIEQVADLDEKLNSYLTSKCMSSIEIKQFCEIVKDVLFVDGNLNVTDSAFLKYLPYLPLNNSLLDKEQKKYKSGEIKVANYLFSMRDVNEPYPSECSHENLFINVLKETLKGNGLFSSKKESEDYYILPVIKASFKDDFKWLMEQEEIVKCKYVSLFFYFYACYGVIQSILTIKRTDGIEKEQNTPLPIYFMLASEKASANHDAVLRGWQKYFQKGDLERLYGEVQAIDIANSLLGDNIGLWPELLAKMEESPFEENKILCEEILQLLRNDKISMFSNRNSESADGYQEISLSVDSYKDFITKLRHICVHMQSPSYSSRIKKKVTDLLSIRFLKKRREYQVLVLDNEMLLFLIAMVTKSKKTKLEDMYKQLRSYGIYLNRGSRLLVEDYLLNLNLLDRKSDSGEAQYVKVVL